MSGEDPSLSSNLRAVWRWTGTRACALVAAGLVFAFAVAYQLTTQRLSGDVAFQTDQVHHQFLAVNLLHGHGYQVGPVDDFAVYRIEQPPRSHDYYKRFIRSRAHRYTFGRTPGYPLLLAGIYAVCGVEPASARVVQALLNALAAASLVLLGTLFWSRPGGLAGLIAAAAHTAFYASDPSALMAEPLVAVGLLGVTGGYLLWSRKRTAPRALALGLLVALALLIRPNVVFLPLVFAALVLARVRPVSRAAVQCLALVAGVLLPILPWSAYATARSEEPGRQGEGAGLILLSTQPSRTLLDGNNEASLDDGRWHPEWRTSRAGDQRFFYNRAARENRSTASLLAEFWADNLARLPGLFARKIAVALERPRDLGALLAMLAFYLALAISAAFRRRVAQPVGAFLPLILWANLLAIVAILFGDSRFVQPFVPLALLPAAYFPLFAAGRIIDHVTGHGDRR
jgi:4-amino-4-deoxy-L-arabinose transferase-like glycosyltransferase